MHETTLIGSMSPIHIKGRNFQERFAPQTVVASLMGVGIDSPAALLATWITDRKGLERFAAGAPPVTDDKPRVEYGSWVRSDEVVDLLPEILALKSDVPVENADSALKAEVQQRRAVLMDFYSAGLAAYAHDQTAWRTAIARVEAAEPENAYYRWVVGRD